MRLRLETERAVFQAAQQALLAGLAKPAPDQARVPGLIATARAAAVRYWQLAAEELDAMLQMRVGKLEADRNGALGLSALALAGAAFLSWYLLRSITVPLESVMRELDPESVALRETAERLAGDRWRNWLTKEESTKLSLELSQQSNMIRRAVIELATQVSGGTSDWAVRVEGVPARRAARVRRMPSLPGRAGQGWDRRRA